MEEARYTPFTPMSGDLNLRFFFLKHRALVLDRERD